MEFNRQNAEHINSIVGNVMKNILLIYAFSLISFFSYGQSDELADSLAMLKSVSKEACLCVDSIVVSNKTHEEISKEISVEVGILSKEKVNFYGV